MGLVTIPRLRSPARPAPRAPRLETEEKPPAAAKKSPAARKSAATKKSPAARKSAATKKSPVPKSSAKSPLPPANKSAKKPAKSAKKPAKSAKKPAKSAKKSVKKSSGRQAGGSSAGCVATVDGLASTVKQDWSASAGAPVGPTFMAFPAGTLSRGGMNFGPVGTAPGTQAAPYTP